MTTFRCDKIVPTAEGAAVLREMAAYVRSPAWPEVCCVVAWLRAHGFDVARSKPSVHGDVFGENSAQHARRIWEVAVAYRTLAFQSTAMREGARAQLVKVLEDTAARAV